MKQEERAEMEKMEELRKVIEASPLTQKIKEEKAAGILAKRREAASKIEALKKQREEVIPKLLADLEMKEENYKKKKFELDAVLGEFRMAKAELSGEGFRFDNEIGQQEEILLETADPIIDETITFFRDRRETLFRKKADSQTRKVGSNIFTMIKEFITFSNAGAIKDALTYCLAAIRELEAMKLTPTLDTERIETLKRGIPDTDEMTEITSEKPFPKINTDPRDLLKSESQENWELGKLHEDFKRLMRK